MNPKSKRKSSSSDVLLGLNLDGIYFLSIYKNFTKPNRIFCKICIFKKFENLKKHFCIFSKSMNLEFRGIKTGLFTLDTKLLKHFFVLLFYLYSFFLFILSFICLPFLARYISTEFLICMSNF